MLWLVWWARLQKERLDGCWFPITLPVTDGLGENAAGALNALVPVPASGGGRRPCARGLSIHTSLFPYSTVAGARAPVDLYDALSAFEATGVDNCACDRGASSQGPLICVRVLSSCALVRVPLTDTLDSSHRVSIRALARVEALLIGRDSRGARERPRGGSPRALGGILTPSRVMLPNPRKRS